MGQSPVNTVAFAHAVETGSWPDVLPVHAAGWFVELLRRIPGLEIDPQLCQEDWGVVVFAKFEGRRFWIGLGWNGDSPWLAFIVYRTFWQRFFLANRSAFGRLAYRLHEVLRADPDVSDIAWYSKDDLMHNNPLACPPIEF